MIHILAHNPAIRRELEAILSDLDYPFTFHQELEPLEKAIKRLSKEDYVFYDLHLENQLWAFERLYLASKRTNFVAVEKITSETSLENNQCPAGVENYLLLPAQKERAKSRLQSLLRKIAQNAVARKRKKAVKSEVRKKAAPKASSRQGGLPSHRETVAPTIARYLHARSAPMQMLLADIQEAVEKAEIIAIDGEEDSEFELVAREINFRANGDSQPLQMIDPLQIDSGELLQLFDRSGAEQAIEYLYLGQTFDWTNKAVDEIENFLEIFESGRLTGLKIILAHPENSDSYFSERVQALVKRLLKKAQRLQLPNMGARREDIAMIVYNVFSTLRMAHPFLRTRVLTSDAVRYLQAECESMNYARLTRIVRNAMALSVGETITTETLRNLSDDTPMTQHLIESLADERYFKSGGE